MLIADDRIHRFRRFHRINGRAKNRLLRSMACISCVFVWFRGSRLLFSSLLGLIWPTTALCNLRIAFLEEIVNVDWLHGFGQLKTKNSGIEVKLPIQSALNVFRLSKTMLLTFERNIGDGNSLYT